MAPSILGFCLGLAGLVAGSDSCENLSVDLLQRKLQMNESRALRGSKPNLLFVVLDQWRWDWTGLDEVPVQMPTVKRLAEQGVRFTRSYTASPQCVPSRTALATVREYKHSFAVNNSDLFDSPNFTTTFMAALRDGGYTTMMVGKDHLSLAMADRPKLERKVMTQLGFDHYHRMVDKYQFCDPYREDSDEYVIDLSEAGMLKEQCSYYGSFGYPGEYMEGKCCAETPNWDLLSATENGFRCQEFDPLDEEWSPDTWIRRKASQLLRQHVESTEGKTKPWFLQVNFVSPHPPFIVKPSEEPIMKEMAHQLPRAIDAEYEGMLVFNPKPKIVPYVLEEALNISNSRKQYATLLHQLDNEIKELLDVVEEIGATDNTIIALAGDHGEHLGDHRHFGKISPFECAAHVPTILAGKTLPVKGIEEHRPVSLIDIPMTFLDLAGIEATHSMQGYSLLPALTGHPEKLARPAVMFGMHYWEIEWESGFSHGKVSFDAAAALFGDSFLKLICCPVGCRKTGTLLPLVIGEPQVVLLNVTRGTGKHYFEHDILNQPPGHGLAEAQHLAQFLADDFRRACLPLLQTTA